jgi:hypothetical protein
MMKMAKAFWPSFVLLLTPLLGTSALADPLAQVPAQYAKFSLSPVDLAQMDNDDDKECVRRANIMHVVEPSLTRCAITQVGHLESRVQFAYSNALVRFSGARRQALQRDQANWGRNYEPRCKEQLGLATGQTSRFEAFPLLRCKAHEVYRRALWLERVG